MKETVISWTFVNWVTIVSMFFLMLIALGFVMRVYASYKGRDNA